MREDDRDQVLREKEKISRYNRTFKSKESRENPG